MSEYSQSRDRRSRREKARARVGELLGTSDETREGIDARSRGPDKSGVDARTVDVDEEAVDSSGKASESYSQGVPTAQGPDRRPSAKGLLRNAASKSKTAAKERARSKAQDAKEKATRENLVKFMIANSSDIGLDDSVKEKSRNQEVVERATEAAHIQSPMSTSLEMTGDPGLVSEMARASSADSAGLLSGSPTSVDAAAPLGVGPGFGVSWDDDEESQDGVGFPSILGDADDDDRDEDDEESEPFDFDDPFGIGGEF